MSTIEVPTRFGPIPARYPFMRHADSKKLAVLFPGRGYTLDAPLMWYAANAALQSGCDVLGVEYGYQANRVPLDLAEVPTLVAETVPVLNGLDMDQYLQVVFIGKSLGTMIQSQVAQRVRFDVRSQVFLTPVRPAIHFITQSERALVVVGDQDDAFGPEDIEQVSDLSSVQVCVIPNANHGLETGDVATSIYILKDVMKLVSGFCQE